MKYIINADLEHVYMIVIDDPEIVDKRKYAAGWSKADFKILTGIEIPANVTGLSIEPHRNMYTITYDNGEGEIVKKPEDHPVIEALYEARREIKRHLHAQRLSHLSNDFTIYTYNPETDKIEEESHPEKDSLLARRELGASVPKLAAHFVALIGILKNKGVIKDADLPTDMKDDIATLIPVIENINWDGTNIG